MVKICLTDLRISRIDTKINGKVKFCLTLSEISDIIGFKKTIDMYGRRIRAFSDFIGTPFDKVGTYDIRYYLASLKETGISDRTLENYRSYISAFYQWLAREDFIQKNPCDKINPIKYREEIKKPFTDIEMDKLRSACSSVRDRAIIETLLSSGKIMIIRDVENPASCGRVGKPRYIRHRFYKPVGSCAGGQRVKRKNLIHNHGLRYASKSLFDATDRRQPRVIPFSKETATVEPVGDSEHP